LESGTAKKGAPEKSAEKPSKALPKKPDTTTQQQSLGRGLRVYDDVVTTDQQKTRATKTKQSKSTVPHNYSTVDIQVDKLLQVVQEHLDQKTKNPLTTLNDWVVRAAAITLRQVPEVNRRFDASSEDLQQLSTIDISVSVPEKSTLVTLKEVDRKSVRQISQAIKAKADEGSESESPSGALTVSILGVNSFTAIINSPQAAILAVGIPQHRFILSKFDENDTTPSKDDLNQPPTKGTFINVTLSSDERVVDPSIAAKWLQRFKDVLEEPENML